MKLPSAVWTRYTVLVFCVVFVYVNRLAGISAMTALPFSPPTDFRTIIRPRASKTEKSEILEGKCHRCCRWIAIEGVKDVPVKVC